MPLYIGNWYEGISMRYNEIVTEKWSEKYKRSIDCSRPRGFSQRAHCGGRKKKVSENDLDDFMKSFGNAVRGGVSQMSADTAIANARGLFKFKVGDIIINPRTGKVFEIIERLVQRNIPKYYIKDSNSESSAKAELVDKNFIKINDRDELTENSMNMGVVPGSGGMLPPEPGTVDIPAGTVRLYHQSTPENLEKIAETGLSIEHARGIEGPRAIYASERGFYGEPGRVPTLEFYVDRDKWDDPFVLEDVSPQQMIAIHLPWHGKARYILDNPDTLEKTLRGEFDDLGDDYAKAVEYVKHMKKNNLSESEQRWYYGNRQPINKNKIISENEGYKLSQLAKVSINMRDADFWLVRRGSIGDVGRPSRDWNPEDIGIKIVMTDLVQPKFFYYLMEYLWQAGYWRERAVGTTRLVNIRIEDVKNMVFGNK
jgi:hypothetical protein